MKKIVILSLGIIGLTMMSFKKNDDNGKVDLLANGNYYIPLKNSISLEDKERIMELDAKEKAIMIEAEGAKQKKEKTETRIFTKSINLVNFSETIVTTKTWVVSPEVKAEINELMAKYL